jgi:hypothetical protein
MDSAQKPSAEEKSMQELFRHDVLVTLVHHLRATAWLAGADRVPPMFASVGITLEHPNEIFNPDWTIKDWGLTWASIAGLDFSIYLDNLFQYGHFGLQDVGWEPIEDETGYTWVSLVLMDLESSAFIDEWSGGYGGEGQESISRCLQVAELANARKVLESGSPFCYQLSAKGRGNEQGVDGLSVRQLALLAGMEEMSVRAAANPKRPNALETFSDNGRTRIAPDVAKRWLESKGRYIPIKTFNSGRDDDLYRRAFASVPDLIERCRNKISSVAKIKNYKVSFADRVAQFLEDGNELFSDTPPWSLEQQRSALTDPVFVVNLASTLDVPAELLSLRVREVLAKDELQLVQQTLRDMAPAQAISQNGGPRA